MVIVSPGAISDTVYVCMYVIYVYILHTHTPCQYGCIYLNVCMYIYIHMYMYMYIDKFIFAFLILNCSAFVSAISDTVYDVIIYIGPCQSKKGPQRDCRTRPQYTDQLILCVCVCFCFCLCMFVCVCVCVFYIHTHTRTHTHAHTHMYMYMHI